MTDDDKVGSQSSGGDQAALITSLSSIEGFWLIERFENFEPSWQNGAPWRSAFVQISDGHLTYSLGCNRAGKTVALSRDGILQDTDDGLSVQTLVGCGPVAEDHDSRFFAFFGSNPEIRTLGSGRLSLTSKSGDLVLARPETWRGSRKPDFSEIEGQWVPQMLSSYDGWGSVGAGIGEKNGIVTIERSRLRWSLCPELPLPIRWSDDARLVSHKRVNVNKCAAVDRATENGPGAVMRMLNADPLVLRTGPDHIVLVDGTTEKGRRLDLQSVRAFEAPPLPPRRRTPIQPPEPPPDP